MDSKTNYSKSTTLISYESENKILKLCQLHNLYIIAWGLKDKDLSYTEISANTQRKALKKFNKFIKNLKFVQFKEK